MRTTLRWMLPAAGAVGAVLGLAHGADAAITGAIAAPSGVSAGGTLTWTFPTDYTDASPTSTTCVVTKPATPTTPATSTTLDCSTGQVSTLADAGSGSYTLDVYNGTDTTVAAADTSTTVVTPDAPTAVASTGTTTPTWTLSDADPNVTGYDPCTLASTPTGATTTPTCTISGSTLTLSTTGATPGAYTWTVSAHNGGGVSGPATPVSYTVPTPAAPTTTNPDRTGYDRSPTWTLTDSDPGLTGYTCTLTTAPAGATVTPDCTTTPGTLALALAGQPLGTYAVRVVAQVNGVDSDPLTVQDLLTAPPAPTATTAVDIRASTDTNAWTVTDSDTNATFACTVSGPAGSSATVGCDPSGHVTLTVTGQPRGTYTVSVTAVDDTGTSAALTLTYRYAPPAPTLVTGTLSATGTNRAPTWSVTDDDSAPTATWSCDVTGPGAGPTVDCTTTPGTVALDLTGQPAGTYTVTVTVADGALTSDPLTLDYLLVPPAPASDPGNTSGTGRSPSWSLTDTDPGVSAYSCTVSGPGGTTGATVDCTTTAGTMTLQLAGQPAGTYTVQASALDAGVASAPVTVTYLLVPPRPTSNPGDLTSTSRSPSWSLADADPGVSSYTCSVSGPAGSTASADCATTVGTLTVDLSGQPAGTYTVTVHAVDNTVASAALTISYTLVPPAPTTSPGDTSGTGRSPSWSLSDADPGVTSYTCSVTGPAGSTATADCGSTFGTLTVPLAGQPAGTYTVTVQAVDNGIASSAVSVSYLLVPPAPATTPGSISGTGRAPSWTLSDADPGVSSYTCSVTGPGSGATADCTSSFGTLTLGLAGQPAGTYTVSVQALDNSVASAVTSFSYLLVPPAPTTTPGSTSGTSRTPSWTLADSDAGVSSYTCSMTGPGAAATADCTTTFGTLALSLAGAPAGTYTVTVRAIDNGVSSAATTFTYLLVPPAPTTAPGDVTGTGRAPSWQLSDTDAGVSAYVCSVSGPGAGAGVDCATTFGTLTLNLSGQSLGTYTVTVTALDNGVPSASTSFTYTLVPPPAPTSTPGDVTGTGRAPSWQLTDTDPYLSGYACTVSGPPSSRATVDCTSALGTLTLDLSGQPLGSYTVTVRAVDAGVVSAPLSVVYTLVPPAAPTSVPGDATGTGRTPSWSLSDTDPYLSGYTCTVSGPGRTAAVDCVSTPGTLVLDVNGQPAGTYTITVRAVDAGVTSAPLTITYLLVPPAPTTAQPAATGTGRTPSWQLSDADPGLAGYTCSVTGPGAGATVSCATSTLALDLAGQPAGTYTVTVNAVDNGVASAPLTLTYLLVPPAPTTAPTSATGTGRTHGWTLSDADPGLSGYGCTVTGPGATASVTCSGSSLTLDLTGQPAGTYTIAVHAVDNAVSSASALTVTYTLVPPAPTSPQPAVTGAGRAPTLPVSDSDPGLSGYQCTVSGPVGSTAAVDCATTGTVSLNLTSQPAGTYTATVLAVDNGVVSAPLTITYTLIPPPPTAVTYPRSPDSSRSPTWTVTDGMPAVTYLCTVTGPSAVPVTCANGTVALDLRGAAEGSYTVSLLALDTVGHTSDASAPLRLTYLLDTIAPAAPIVTVTPSPSQGRTATYAISGVEPAGTVGCGFSAPAGSTVTVTSACGGGASIDLTGQPDGAYVLTVTVTDAAGNTSAATVATYVLDTTPPVAPVATIQSPGNDETPTPTLVVEPGVSLTCAIQRYFLPVATVACGTDGTVNLSGLADGEFEISVWATDVAGNVGPPSAPYVYLLDTVPPAMPSLTAPASPSPVEDPVWRWTSDANTTGTCTVTNVAGVVVGGPFGCSDLFTGDFTALPDGAYTFSVAVSDAAGNLSRPATSVFILDRTAPVPPTVVPPTSPGNTTTPRWLITAPRGATLTCTLTRGRTVIMGPGACPAGGLVSLLGMPDGTYTMRVTATDPAGNISAASITTYVLDTVAPAAPTLDYGSPSAGTSRSPFWGFTLPAGAVGRCELLSGGTVVAVRTDCRGAVSFTITGTDGPYAVRITALDAAGNASAPLVVGYQLYGHGGGAGAGAGTPGSGGSRAPRGPKLPPPGTVQRLIDHLGTAAGQAGKAVRRAAAGAASVLPGLPVIHDPLTNNVSHAVQNVINAVSKAGGGTGFPLLLLVIVGLFLMAQSRMDRRDPKLALASVAADDNLQFGPPPSRGDAR